MTGPLSGIRIIELAGIGPGPFTGMMLADHGAEVIYCHRAGQPPNPKDPLLRGRVAQELDLKSSEGVAKLRALVASADGLIEGFRPGVMERLGLGPDVLCGDNPALVYGRMTGWGQFGPLAQAAGHDINYIALSGALHAFGREGERPVPPVNAVGDFGGGGMLLAFGMVSGLLAAKMTGKGTVIDAAMTDGSALLMSMIWGFRQTMGWQDRRGVNILDTGAHFYEVYETADGKHVALGAIEPQFYAAFRQAVGLAEDNDFDAQFDRRKWPELKAKLAALFATKTRDAWVETLSGFDACFAPVLSMDEAAAHPHNVARQTFVDCGGVLQPAAAPRFTPIS